MSIRILLNHDLPTNPLDRHVRFFKVRKRIIERTIRDDPHTSILFSIGDRDIIQVIG